MKPSREELEIMLDRRHLRVVPVRTVGMSAALGGVFLIVLVLILLGGAAPGGAESDGPALSQGQRVYLQYCAPCHSQDGSGNPAIQAPAINQTGEAWKRSQTELELHVLEGGGSMPALSGVLSESDVAVILEYMQEWWTDEQVEAFRANP